MEYSQTLPEKPNFELHQIYRALEVLSKETDYIQEKLYRNSCSLAKRNDRILYYDVTNYYFEVEEADEDGGLSSKENRAFNTVMNRRFITVQSVKKFKKKFKDWTLADDGWSCLRYPDRTFRLSDINDDSGKYHDDVFFKERWDLDNRLSQRFIVTYSIKYKEYLRSLRDKHIKRAQDLIESGRINHSRPTDCRRLIAETAATKDGEVADEKTYSIDSGRLQDRL